MSGHLFDLDRIATVLNSNRSLVNVVLQFPDELLHSAIETFIELVSKLHEDKVVFITADSTYGSSVDDVSALHVNADVLIYFGSDLSSSGSIPVIVCPAIKRFNVDDCITKILSSSFTDTTVPVLICYDPSYHTCIEVDLYTRLLKEKKDSNIIIASLPSYVNGSNLEMSNLSDVHGNQATSSRTLGGLLVSDVHWEIMLASDAIIIWYIGDKKAQLDSISLSLSRYTIMQYDPANGEVSRHIGDESKQFRERCGGMLKVENANIIGLIVGSMGLTGEATRDILDRLQRLIEEAGKKHYCFVMGRLNEAKLANFPEIDIFCLISNEDVAAVEAKTFHIPVITPWELELGLGAREWSSVFRMNSASILDGHVTSEVALQNVRARRLQLNPHEDDQDDSNAEIIVDGVKPADNETKTNCMPSSVLTKIAGLNDTALATFDSAAASYLTQRTYRGLDPHTAAESAIESGTAVVPGQFGVASSYRAI